MKSHTYGYIYAVLAAFFFSLIAIIGKGLISGGTHPIQVTFYEYLNIVILLGVWLAIKNPKSFRIKTPMILRFSLLGIIGGTGTTLFFYSALQYLDAGVTSMLLFINPVYITLFFAITGIRKMKWMNYVSVLMAVFGAAMVLDFVSNVNHLNPKGILLGICSGLCYAFYNVYADLKLKEEDPNVINFYACIASFVLTLILLWGSGQGFIIHINDYLSIFILAGLSGILPIYFIFKALKHIGSEKVSVIASVELPFTLIMAFTILQEHMAASQLFGIVLIIASTILIQRSEG